MTMHANNVVHFAIHAQDVDRAQSFYRAVFNWQFEAWGPPGFFRITTGTEDDPGIEGALQTVTDDHSKGGDGFICTISVADIEATRQLIERHGGTVTYSGEIPTVGKIVSFNDTESNSVCAMQYD